MALTATMASFIYIYNEHNLTLLLLPSIQFIILKLVVQYLIYEPVKYKDDGRDVVTIADFITIHVTFPVVNAWVTYQMYFGMMVTLTTICSTRGLYQSHS